MFLFVRPSRVVRRDGVYAKTVNNRPGGGAITSPGVGFCGPGPGFCGPGGGVLVLVDVVACHYVYYH